MSPTPANQRYLQPEELLMALSTQNLSKVYGGELGMFLNKGFGKITITPN